MFHRVDRHVTSFAANNRIQLTAHIFLCLVPGKLLFDYNIDNTIPRTEASLRYVTTEDSMQVVIGNSFPPFKSHGINPFKHKSKYIAIRYSNMTLINCQSVIPLIRLN